MAELVAASTSIDGYDFHLAAGPSKINAIEQVRDDAGVIGNDMDPLAHGWQLRRHI